MCAVLLGWFPVEIAVSQLSAAPFIAMKIFTAVRFYSGQQQLLSERQQNLIHSASAQVHAYSQFISFHCNFGSVRS